jgi:hypothetical protein
MTTRVAHVFARCTGTAPCSRCGGAAPVAAGTWHAAEPDATHLAVCDGCALHDDPQGFAALGAWRRAAAGPTTGRRWAA